MYNDLNDSSKETDELIEDLKKQMKKLDSKIGNCADAWAYESMKDVLFNQLLVNVVYMRALSFKFEKPFEVDVLAYFPQEVYVIKIAEKLTNEHLEEMHQILNKFPYFFPWHKDKSLYGIIAAVNAPDQMKQRVFDAGFYLGWIRDDTFNLDIPKDFKAKRFN